MKVFKINWSNGIDYYEEFFKTETLAEKRLSEIKDLLIKVKLLSPAIGAQIREVEVHE